MVTKFHILKHTSSVGTVPTVGFSIEEFTIKNCKYLAVDMSGQSKYRSLWPHYYAESDGIVFVIDATDRLRFAVAREELRMMLADSGQKDIQEKNCIVYFRL
jgi:ADP-ribosylation factor-like protein 6